MSEKYLLQEAMRLFHDKIAQFDDFVPRVWKEEEDECVTGMCFYKNIIFFINIF